MPATLALALSEPRATAVAVTLAWPLFPVLAVAEDRLRPVPAKFTVTPERRLPALSLTTTSKGLAKAEPMTALWVEPET